MSKVPRSATSCVLVAIRHSGLNEGIRGLLATVFDSVVMVADEPSLCGCAESMRPDLAVVDFAVGRGGSGGADLIARLRARLPETRVLVIGDNDPALARAALHAGADGYLRISALGAELLPAVDRLLGGRAEEGSEGTGTGAPPTDGCAG